MTKNNKKSSIYCHGKLAAFVAACSLALMPAAYAQQAPLSISKLNAFEMRVTDPAKSVKFYQDIFGMPVVARVGDTVSLRIGDGPAVMQIRPVTPGEAPGMTWLGYSVENFNLAEEQAKLQSIGFKVIDAPDVSAPGIDNAMSTWVRMRGDTPELFFADERGLIVHLSDTSYCGGTGPMGNVCSVEAPAPAGILAVKELNHFTVNVSDGNAANEWYQKTFGLTVQSHQGPAAPVTGIGDGYQFVMYGSSRSPAAEINHVNFNMTGFDVDGILAKLTAYGLSEGNSYALPAMQHFVSLRQPERGGAPGGTPEVYFADMDGIKMQVQDMTYCGGGGYLGSECLED